MVPGRPKLILGTQITKNRDFDHPKLHKNHDFYVPNVIKNHTFDVPKLATLVIFVSPNPENAIAKSRKYNFKSIKKLDVRLNCFL